MRADFDDFPLFQHAQKFGLLRERHAANFIQKQRAMMRDFEPSHFIRRRASKCPFRITEKFTFEQRIRNRRHVDGAEHLVFAPTQPMNPSGDQLFPRAAFAKNQDWRFIRLRHFGHQFQHMLNLSTISDNMIPDPVI